MPIDVKNRPSGTWIDTTNYEALTGGDATVLLDGAPDGSFPGLNAILMHSSMSQALHDFVLGQITAIDPMDLTGRVREAIYLIASSSEYQVAR
jgi:hypothetical protein